MRHAATQSVEDLHQEPRRAGTPSKGKRQAITTRVPEKHLDVYDEAAREHGMRRSDYIAWLLAKAHNLDEPWWLRRNKNQPGLPYDESEQDADSDKAIGA